MIAFVAAARKGLLACRGTRRDVVETERGTRARRTPSKL